MGHKDLEGLFGSKGLYQVKRRRIQLGGIDLSLGLFILNFILHAGAPAAAHIVVVKLPAICAHTSMG